MPLNLQPVGGLEMDPFWAGGGSTQCQLLIGRFLIVNHTRGGSDALTPKNENVGPVTDWWRNYSHKYISDFSVFQIYKYICDFHVFFLLLLSILFNSVCEVSKRAFGDQLTRAFIF